MKKTSIFFLLLLVFIAVIGCNPISSGNHQDVFSASTPSFGKGSVKGQLAVEPKGDLTGLTVYLGEAIKIEGQFTGGLLNTSKAPFSLVDPLTGNFLIKDVDPGTYVLVIYEVVAGGRAYQDESGNIMSIEVKPNEIIDLGTIRFSFNQ